MAIYILKYIFCLLVLMDSTCPNWQAHGWYAAVEDNICWQRDDCNVIHKSVGVIAGMLYEGDGGEAFS